MLFKKRSERGVFLFGATNMQWLGWSLFCLSWLMPNHYMPWPNFHSEAMAFLAIAVLFAATLMGSASKALRWTNSALWCIGVALLPWIQFMFGISPFAGDAWMVSYYLVGWGLAILIGYNLALQDPEKSVLALMHMLWVAALVSAVIGLLQWLKLDESLGIYVAQTDIGDPAMGNLAQPNQLGTLLLMGIAAFAYVFERQIIGKATLALGVIVLTFVLMLTHSRTAMVGVLVIGTFLLAKHSTLQLRIARWHIVAWVVLFVLLSFASPYIDQALMLSVDREPLFTANGRTLIWLQTLDGIRQSPWTGYGWNQTFTATSTGAIRYPGVLVATYAHNVLLDIIAWSGIPLGVALIGLGAYWVCTRLDGSRNTASVYAMACLLPVGLHSMVELSFAYAYFLLAAGLLIGVVEASVTGLGTRQTRRHLVASALAFWVGIGGYICYEYMLIEEDVRVTRFENLRVGATDPDYPVPTIRLLSHMATVQRATRMRPAPQMTAQQLEDMRLAVRRIPNGGTTLRYAIALGLNGDPPGAMHTMDIIYGVYGPQYYANAKKVWNEEAQTHAILRTITLPH